MVPEPAPTVTNVLLLLHAPPAIPGLIPKVVEFVPHTMNDVVPVITGVELSFTTWAAVQPAPGVMYVIVLVPGATPVIVPELDPTVTNVLLLLHVPPVMPGLIPNVVEFVAHTINDVVPVITGTGLSVTTWVAVQPAPGVV